MGYPLLCEGVVFVNVRKIGPGGIPIPGAPQIVAGKGLVVMVSRLYGGPLWLWGATRGCRHYLMLLSLLQFLSPGPGLPPYSEHSHGPTCAGRARPTLTRRSLNHPVWHSCRFPPHGVGWDGHRFPPRGLSPPMLLWGWPRSTGSGKGLHRVSQHCLGFFDQLCSGLSTSISFPTLPRV